MSRALVVLPLTLAVLLVSLCIPMMCSAQMMEKECAPVAPACTPAMAGTPMHHQTPPPTGDPVCKHNTANVQAVNPDQQVHVAAAVAALAVVAPALPAPTPLATVVDQRPAKPPGLVLTVSQLRI